VAAVISRSVPRQPRRRQAMGLRFATRGRATLLNRGSATEAVAPIFDLGSHPVRSIDMLASAISVRYRNRVVHTMPNPDCGAVALGMLVVATNGRRMALTAMAG
jgi:hypothetical protein